MQLTVCLNGCLMLYESNLTFIFLSFFFYLQIYFTILKAFVNSQSNSVESLQESAQHSKVLTGHIHCPRIISLPLWIFLVNGKKQMSNKNIPKGKPIFQCKFYIYFIVLLLQDQAIKHNVQNIVTKPILNKTINKIQKSYKDSN